MQYRCAVLRAALKPARGTVSPRLTKSVVARAGVSESEFHEAFMNVEECFSAAFQQSLVRLTTAVERAAGHEQRWLSRIRSGLVALLGFFDDEPGRGRLLLFAASTEPTVAFRYEQRVQGVLAGLLDDGTPPAIAQLTHTPALSAQLIRGGVLSVIRSRMSDPEQDGGPLVELAPPLTSFIAVAYLGQAAATEELLLGSPSVRPPAAALQRAVAAVSSPIPVTRRTTLVLGAIARTPRSSNREIAAAAGIVDEGQISNLLRRLAQRGLIAKVAPRSGSRRENAWLLTPSGRRVIELLGLDSAEPVRVSTAVRVRQVA